MEVMNDSITLHIFAQYIFLAIIVFNIYSVISLNDFVKLARRLKFTTPLFHFMNALIIYTGAIVSAFTRSFTLTTAFMLIASIAVMVLEIKRYKKMRVIKSKDTKAQEEFRAFAKRIYLIQIAILVAVYIISKVF